MVVPGLSEDIAGSVFPGLVLSFHPEWRKVSIHKRVNLIVGYFLSTWVVLLSFGIQDPLNIPNAYNFLLLGSAVVIGFEFWWLRRKQTKAEVIFP